MSLSRGFALLNVLSQCLHRRQRWGADFRAWLCRLDIVVGLESVQPLLQLLLMGRWLSLKVVL